jgi:hypothetical protein
LATALSAALGLTSAGLIAAAFPRQMPTPFSEADNSKID